MDWTVHNTTVPQTSLVMHFSKFAGPNREHQNIVENMIRGGLASVYDERYFKANNKYLEIYDSALESTFGFIEDANNLYGGIMKTEHLSVGDFLLVEVPVEQVLNTPTDSP